MPKCCEYLCDTKYNESLFSVPKYLKREWEKALNMELIEKSKVCRKHFNPQDIISTWELETDLSKYSVSTYIYELSETVKVN